MASASCLRRSSARCVILTPPVSIPTRPRPRRLRHMRQSARGFRQKARQYNRYHEGVLLLWGEGPFTAELFGEEAESAPAGRRRVRRDNRQTAARRPVRRSGVALWRTRTGADCLALTKLDILSALKEIRVCTAYDVGGTITEHFPTGHALGLQSRSFETLPGWNCDISSYRKAEDLPKEALDYIKYIEKLVGCPIKYVSVGAEREAYITMD